MLCEPVQWLCAALPGLLGMPGQVRPGHGLAHVLLRWDVLVLCSSFKAVWTLGLTAGVWHFGLCLGRCEQCWEFDVISKRNSRGWLFFQLLKVNSWTYCFCTNPNRPVGGNAVCTRWKKFSNYISARRFSKTSEERDGEVTSSVVLFACCWLAGKIRHDEKTSYKAVQTSEEGSSAGEYQGPLMVLAQNCAVMHNLLGPACIFLRKGFAENRQPVRKLHPAGRDTHKATWTRVGDAEPPPCSVCVRLCNSQPCISSAAPSADTVTGKCLTWRVCRYPCA